MRSPRPLSARLGSAANAVRGVIPFGLVAVGLCACGGKVERTPAPVAIAAHTAGGGARGAADLAARGLAGRLSHRALILAGPGVSDVELFAVYYGLVSHGWSVQIAASATSGVRTQGGAPVPVDVAAAEASVDHHEVLFVPAGVPSTPESLALIGRFAGARHLAYTAASASHVEAAGVVPLAIADDDMVRVERAHLVAARTGDVPALIHALHTVAQDGWSGARGPR